MASELTTALPAFAIVGAGKVGLTIAFALQEKGYPLLAIAGRDLNKTRAASRILGDVNVCLPREAAKNAQIVFLAVSDDAIESVCEELANDGVFSRGQIIGHFSGALSSMVLSSARAKCGAIIASVHPLQTFSNLESAIASMPGSFWFAEGDDAALSVLSRLINDIGGIPNIIPSNKKVLYHCASVIACNYLVSLMDLALTVAETASLDRDLAWKALSPLIQATLRNIDAMGTAKALTGPISRADLKTVEGHLQELSNSKKEIADIYRLMGAWTVKVALQKGLSEESAEELSRILRKQSC